LILEALCTDVPGAVIGAPKDAGLEGDVITFQIGSRVVAKYEWHTGTNTHLDFHPPEAIPAATSGNEGAEITFSGSSIDFGSDIASYALDWDNDTTFEDTGLTVSHTWSDNGTYPVVLKVTDLQGGEGIKTFDVTVNNVAPTATFNSPDVDEGSDILLSLTSPYDPSSVDTSAGFTYNFDCGSGYIGWSSTSTASCPTTDKGTRSVGGKIQDKDGAITTYSDSVTINDVLPTAVNAHGPYNGIAGQSVSLTGSATCVSVDACTFNWDLDNDSVYDDATGTSPTHTWNTIGVYPISLKVTDNDGNAVTDSTTVTIAGATYPITLMPGWNLISFNLVPPNTSPATVLANIASKYDLVYAWDGTVGSNNWLKYAPAGPGYANTLTNMHETMGFWIHVTSADPTTILNVVGSIPSSTSITLSSMGGGWNLVGFPSASGSLGSTPLPGVMSSHGLSVFSLVYAYHAYDTADQWKLFDNTPGVPGFANDLKFMEPGWGYWVNMSGANETWTVTY
jgi:PKD repeat protein